MQDGKISSFIAFLAIAFAIFYAIKRAQNQLPGIRQIAGLEAIEEAIGRATETGKPVFYTTGTADVTTSTAAVTFASLEILGYATRIVARNRADMMVGICQANVYSLALPIVEMGYLQGGAPELFSPENVQFFSSAQWAYAARCMGYIQREKPATTLMLGHFMAEAMLVAETSSQANAITISGMTSMAQIPFLVAACDYTLIGDEMLVAGAYLAKDPIKLGSIAGQDWIKLIGACLILVGSVLITAGNSSLIEILKL